MARKKEITEDIVKVGEKVYKYKTTHAHFEALQPYIITLPETVDNFKKFEKWIKDTAKIIASKGEYAGMEIEKKYIRHPETLSRDIENKVKGDLFEIFAELFLQYFETDKGNVYGAVRGTCECQMDGTDFGIDIEYILNGTKDKAHAQAKFRSNPKDQPLNLEVFAKADSIAARKYGWDWKSTTQRLVFITNLKVGERNCLKAATRVFGDLVKDCNNIVLIGAEYFETLNGRMDFWDTFRKLSQ